MVKNLIYLFISMFFIFILSSCQDSGPKVNSLKNYLENKLLDPIEVVDFDIVATENIGNEVDPVFISRFKATLKSSSDLYLISETMNDFNFVTLVVAAGDTEEIHGKTTSKLYSGNWKISLKIDGEPKLLYRNNLLHSELNFPYIMTGSSEEKDYYEKIARDKERTRKNIKIAHELLVGKWTTDKRIFIYTLHDNGTYTHRRIDNNYETYGLWKVEGDFFYGYPMDFSNKYKIKYLDENRFKISPYGWTNGGGYDPEYRKVTSSAESVGRRQ